MGESLLGLGTMGVSLASCHTLCVHGLSEAGQVFVPGSRPLLTSPSRCLEPYCTSDTPSLLTPLGTLLVTTPPDTGRQEPEGGLRGATRKDLE